jgi:hypothetical protein
MKHSKFLLPALDKTESDKLRKKLRMKKKCAILHPGFAVSTPVRWRPSDHTEECALCVQCSEIGSQVCTPRPVASSIG